MMAHFLKVIGITLVLVVMLASPSQAERTVIRFSHVVADDTPKGQMVLRFKKLVESRMYDTFAVEIYPNSTLFDDDQVFEALLLDDVQMAAPSLSKFSNYTKGLQVFDLPFLFKDMAAVDRFQQGPDGQRLLTSFVDRGLVGLGYLHNGFKQFSATKKLLEPADAAGLKFRIQSSVVLEAQFKALGAEGIAKPFSQVYALLSSGVLDGQENTWSNIRSKKFDEVQPYFTESNHGLVDYMVVTSVNFWESLSDNERQQLQEAINEAIAYGNELTGKMQEEAKQAVVQRGKAEVLQLKPAERDKWVEAMRPVWKQFEREIGKDLIEKAYAANQ